MSAVDERPARLRSPLRVALFSLVPLVALLALVEFTLIALGLGPLNERQHVSRGFSPNGAYLLPVGEGHITRLFDGARDRIVPPRGEGPRVVLLGGSNTQVLPEDVLARELREGDPQGRPWEVVNLGREGYGSERVAILAEQVLVLEPDVLVVYSGHNEFVESTFRRLLEAQLGGDPALAEEGPLHALRLYRLLLRALSPPGDDWTRREGLLVLDEPEDAVRSADEVAAHARRFGERLEALAAMARERGVRLVVCTPVSNLLDPPWSPALPDDVTTAAEAAQRIAAARELVPAAYRAGLWPPLRLRLASWYTGALDAVADPPEPRLLRGALSATPRTTALKAASIEGAHWPDPAGWSAPVVTLLETWAALTDRDPSPDEREALREARRLLDEAVERAPDHARARFDRGVVRWLLGDDDGAVADLRAAADLDRDPHKASPTLQQVVRDMAGAAPDVVLVDVAAAFDAGSRAGLVGYELVMDRCHLQPGARHHVMALMARAILAQDG